MPRKLIEAQEEFGTKFELMGLVLTQAGDDNDFAKVKAFGDGLESHEVVTKFRELNTELDALQSECKKLELIQAGERYAAVKDRMSEPAEPVPQPSAQGQQKSIGRMLIESPEFKDFQKDSTQPFALNLPDVELKTLLETAAGWAPESQRTGKLVEAVTRPIQALDLIPMGSTDSASIVYMEETQRTHSGEEVIEGGTYAEDAYELTERTSQVRKISTSVPVTDEQLEDVAQIESYLDQRLRFGLRQRLDTQVIDGDGTPPNLRGILNVAGIQTQAKGTDPAFDAIHKAMTLVRVTGRAVPGGILLHPNDWQDIRLTRTADGIYILGNPAIEGPQTLFGVPVAQGDVITENTGLVGDFQNFCQLFQKRGISIEIGYVGDQFKQGRKTMRADFRVAFVVFRPTAFCQVTGL